MADIVNSHPLTDFQRNARRFLKNLKETGKPVLLTVNGKVEAVLLDPSTFQNLEAAREREMLVAAIREGEQAVREGRTRLAADVAAEMQAKYRV